VSGASGRRERLSRWLLGLGLAGVLLAVNLPTVTSFAVRTIHEIEVNSQGYKEQEGHWSTLSVPSSYRIDAVHAAVLYTGKVLIVAGSGNNLGFFNAGTFKSIIWDPQTNQFKEIPTPSDMFCGGHAFLPDGRLLIAGGTKRYEVLASEVTRASGVMLIQNQSPNGSPIHLPVGSEFTSPSGVAFRSTEDLTIAPATKTLDASGATSVTASTAEVWVEAVNKGPGSIISKDTHFKVAGVGGVAARDFFGISDALNLEKQEFWANEKSYLFNPATESYEKVSNLTLARWYPTLVGLSDGRVLAVSGLDRFGRIIQGSNEIYEPATRTWHEEPRLTRTFPTYPALFLMPEGNLFYSGSNAGYGSSSIGRTPGIWNLHDNSFRAVPGLRDPTETETSGSVLLPPAQAQRYMVVGGGGVGSSLTATSRVDIADLASPEPRFKPAVNLAQPTRYPNLVITPDNKVIITGGARYYRAKHESDIFECHAYDPATNKLTRLADPTVGRDYHSEAALLPDGRIVTLGGNPLYGNKDDTAPGYFEQRIEIYSPPYLYHGARPEITGGPREVSRGQTVTFASPDARDIESVSLIRPSAVTHVTDSEQRSIALQGYGLAGGITVTIPSSAGLVPSGWYMLFVTNAKGTPSEARWVHVA
jgi:hypothetical protein